MAINRMKWATIGFSTAILFVFGFLFYLVHDEPLNPQARQLLQPPPEYATRHAFTVQFLNQFLVAPGEPVLESTLAGGDKKKAADRDLAEMQSFLMKNPGLESRIENLQALPLVFARDNYEQLISEVNSLRSTLKFFENYAGYLEINGQAKKARGIYEKMATLALLSLREENALLPQIILLGKAGTSVAYLKSKGLDAKTEKSFKELTALIEIESVVKKSRRTDLAGVASVIQMDRQGAVWSFDRLTGYLIPINTLQNRMANAFIRNSYEMEEDASLLNLRKKVIHTLEAMVYTRQLDSQARLQLKMENLKKILEGKPET